MMSVRGRGIQHAVIDAKLSGTTDLVTGVAGLRVKVLSYAVSAAAPVDVTFQSGVNDLTGAMSVGPGAFASPASDDPLLVTEPGETLGVLLGATVDVGGHLTYYLEA